MTYFDQNLQRLQECVVRKNQLRHQQKELWTQQDDLKEKTESLAAVWKDEQADVDALNTFSLSRIVKSIKGELEDELVKEQREAAAAQMKYDTACRELQYVKDQLKSVEQELKSLQGCETEFENAVLLKAEEMKAEGRSTAEILSLQDEIVRNAGQLKEIKEAMEASDQAAATLRRAADILEEAHDLGTWDMLGGGIFVTVMKHDKLDEAQEVINQLQIDLRSLKTELADVEIRADIQIEIGEFMSFADYFFDGFFVDWSIQGKIKEAMEKVGCACVDIEQLKRSLERKDLDLKQQKEECEQALYALLV